MSRTVTAASLAAALLTGHLAWNLRALRRPPLDSALLPDAPHRVSVLIPARDEAHQIGPCVRSVLAQRGVDLELLVLDDESTDGTAEAALAAAAGDARLHLLHGRTPPRGWLGKPHACARLADAAAGDVLVFVDADVVLEPGGLAATLALLDASPLDLVSPYPRQLADGIGPRLVQPLLQWSWLVFLPLRLAERLPAPSLTAANGQLLACRSKAYRASGGHAAVRDAVIEDVALARAFKRAGFRACVADGTRVATCRMYGDYSELRDGYTKSLWAAFGSPAGAAGAITLLGWLYVLPPLAALRALTAGRGGLAAIAAAGYFAGVAGRLLAAHRTGGRLTDAPAHPLSVLVLAWLTLQSWRRRRAGDLRWRGRPVGAN